MTKREQLKKMAEHEEGYMARRAGGGEDDNPYSKGTDQHKAWNAGYFRANHEITWAETPRVNPGKGRAAKP